MYIKPDGRALSASVVCLLVVLKQRGMMVQINSKIHFSKRIMVEYEILDVYLRLKYLEKEAKRLSQ